MPGRYSRNNKQKQHSRMQQYNNINSELGRLSHIAATLHLENLHRKQDISNLWSIISAMDGKLDQNLTQINETMSKHVVQIRQKLQEQSADIKEIKQLLLKLQESVNTIQLAHDSEKLKVQQQILDLGSKVGTLEERTTELDEECGDIESRMEEQVCKQLDQFKKISMQIKEVQQDMKDIKAEILSEVKNIVKSEVKLVLEGEFQTKVQKEIKQAFEGEFKTIIQQQIKETLSGELTIIVQSQIKSSLDEQTEKILALLKK